MNEQLKEDLTTLSDSVPLLAKKVGDAIQAADALDREAEELLEDVKEAREDASGHLSKVRDALPVLVVQVETETRRLSAAGDDAEKAWGEAYEGLSAAEQRLGDEADEVLTARLELQRHLAEVGTKVDQAQTQGEAAIDLLEKEAQEAESKLTSAASALSEEVTELKQFLQVAQGSLKDATTALAQRLLDLGRELEQEAGHVIEELKAKVRTHLDTVKEPLDDLREHVHDGLTELEERGQRTVSGPVSEAGLELRTELERLSATAEKHTEALRREGPPLDQAMAELAGEGTLIPNGIRQIDEAARQLRQQ